MADVETSTIVKAIIAIIVLIVMALVVYSIMNFDDVKQIAQEVFHTDTEQEIIGKTEDSVSAFSSELDSCAKGDYNPNSKDNCFCFQKNHGSIQAGSYISIQNTGSASKFTALTENDAPLSQFTKSYNLGLMVTTESDEGYQLGCVFPSQFFIISDEDTLNKWYVKWIDSRLEFWFSADYTFSFYRDDTSSKLAAGPMLYRIDSTHYCLITTLIDEPISYSSSEFISLQATKSQAPALTNYQYEQDAYESQIESVQTKSTYYSSVQTFLLNEELYCNKL